MAAVAAPQNLLLSRGLVIIWSSFNFQIDSIACKQQHPGVSTPRLHSTPSDRLAAFADISEILELLPSQKGRKSKIYTL